MVRKALLLALVIMVAAYACIQTDESDATDEGGKFMVYDLLNEKQKETYNQLYDLVMNLGDSLDCRHLTHDETVDMYYGFMSDHPDIYWFQTDYHFYVFDDTGDRIFFNKEQGTDLQERLDAQKEIDAYASSLVFTGTDAEKVKQIHDYICYNTWYQFRDNCMNMRGTLLQKCGVCAGYAQTFDYLCKMNGIDCLIVRYSDYENDDNSHLWNVVKLDGKWYQLDAMADDPECPGLINYDYFLVGTETLVNGVPFLETEAHEYETDYGLTFEKEASPYSKQPLPEYYYWTFGGNEFPKIFKYSDTIFEANGLNLRFTPESYEVIY